MAVVVVTCCLAVMLGVVVVAPRARVRRNERWAALAIRRVRREVEEAGVYVEVCFGCGSLVPRDCPGYLEIRWGVGDPGRDETTARVRTTRTRSCVCCREDLRRVGGLVTRFNKLEVQLTLLQPVGKWATRGDKVLVVEGVRRVKT